MLGGLAHRRTEIFARAVRDHLADCLVTLPTLLERNADASLHFWYREPARHAPALFPRIADRLRARGATATAATRCAPRSAKVRAHWRRIATDILALHAAGAGDAEDAIGALASAPGTAL